MKENYIQPELEIIDFPENVFTANDNSTEFVPDSNSGVSPQSLW